MNKCVLVEKPYDILDNIIFNTDGSVEATVNNEFLFELEGGPIGCSEFGRHIAVLGEYVIASYLGFKSQNYCLAVSADLKRVHSSIVRSNQFHLFGRLFEKTKRGAKVYGEMMDEHGEVLFLGEVEYQIITPLAFEKIFAKHQIESYGKKDLNPYKYRRGLKNYSISGDIVKAEYGIVEAADCEGHFQKYPALPAAIVGGLYGNLCMPLFLHYYPGFSKVIGKGIKIRAKRLAFPGEHLEFKAVITDRIGLDTIRLSAAAFVGNEIVADAEFELKGVNEDVLITTNQGIVSELHSGKN